MYSNSTVDKAMQYCLLMHHEITPPPNKNKQPEVNLDLSLSVAQSALLKYVRRNLHRYITTQSLMKALKDHFKNLPMYKS